MCNMGRSWFGTTTRSLYLIEFSSYLLSYIILNLICYQKKSTTRRFYLNLSPGGSSICFSWSPSWTTRWWHSFWAGAWPFPWKAQILIMIRERVVLITSPESALGWQFTWLSIVIPCWTWNTDISLAAGSIACFLTNIPKKSDSKVPFILGWFNAPHSLCLALLEPGPLPFLW